MHRAIPAASIASIGSQPKGTNAQMHLIYPLVNIQIAIENGQFIVDLPIKIVIFHSYVSLPEGNLNLKSYLGPCRRNSTVPSNPQNMAIPTERNCACGRLK